MTVRKLQLCDELDRSSCGNVLFNGYLPPPGTAQPYLSDRISLMRSFTDPTSLVIYYCGPAPVYPAKRLNRHSVAGSQFMTGRVVAMERAPVRRSNTMPPNLGNSGILGRANVEERVPGGKHIIRIY